jgi:hypothetical protein
MNDLEQAVAVIREHPVMDKAEVTRADQVSVVAVLKANRLLEVAREIEGMALAEFEDFLVNQCGDD